MAITKKTTSNTNKTNTQSAQNTVPTVKTQQSGNISNKSNTTPAPYTPSSAVMQAIQEKAKAAASGDSGVKISDPRNQELFNSYKQQYTQQLASKGANPPETLPTTGASGLKTGGTSTNTNYIGNNTTIADSVVRDNTGNLVVRRDTTYGSTGNGSDLPTKGNTTDWYTANPNDSAQMQNVFGASAGDVGNMVKNNEIPTPQDVFQMNPDDPRFGAVNAIYQDLSGIKSQIDSYMAGADENAAKIAGAWYNDYLNQLSTGINAQIADLQAQGKEVDPETSRQLKDLQVWAEQEKASMNEELNRRNANNSSIALNAIGMLSNDKLNKLADIQDWALRSKDNIVDKINALRQQLSQGQATGLEKRAAMEAQYKDQAQANAMNWRSQYVNNMLNAAQLGYGREDANWSKDFTTKQFNNDNYWKGRDYDFNTKQLHIQDENSDLDRGQQDRQFYDSLRNSKDIANINASNRGSSGGNDLSDALKILGFYNKVGGVTGDAGADSGMETQAKFTAQMIASGQMTLDQVKKDVNDQIQAGADPKVAGAYLTMVQNYMTSGGNQGGTPAPTPQPQGNVLTNYPQKKAAQDSARQDKYNKALDGVTYEIITHFQRQNGRNPSKEEFAQMLKSGVGETEILMHNAGTNVNPTDYKNVYDYAMRNYFGVKK